MFCGKRECVSLLNVIACEVIDQVHCVFRHRIEDIGSISGLRVC